MNPYFEDPDFWPGVHHWLINEITRSLNRQLSDKYVVAVEVRMYETTRESSTLIAIPDDVVVQNHPRTNRPKSNTPSEVAVADPPVLAQPIAVNVPISETIKQGYLEVKSIGTGEVITAIEILSPVNKKAGKGREQYEDKREAILDSSIHLVEIDLLRKGRRMAIAPDNIKSDYRILVSRSNRRPLADLYAFNDREVIPAFPLPLRPEDREPVLVLKTVIDEIYDQGYSDRMLDYSQDPVPALSETDAVWAEQLLRDAAVQPLRERGWR